MADAAPFFDRTDTIQRHIEHCRAVILERTSTVTKVLDSSGIEYYTVITTPFVWVRLKKGRTSLGFARGLLRRKEVAVAPGSAFGEEGEGWVRISVNIDPDQLQEAMGRFVSYHHPIKTRLKVRGAK
jgi:aspartate/methionine/tyrosine aminotransferase